MGSDTSFFGRIVLAGQVQAACWFNHSSARSIVSLIVIVELKRANMDAFSKHMQTVTETLNIRADMALRG